MILAIVKVTHVWIVEVGYPFRHSPSDMYGCHDISPNKKEIRKNY